MPPYEKGAPIKTASLCGLMRREGPGSMATGPSRLSKMTAGDTTVGSRPNSFRIFKVVGGE